MLSIVFVRKITALTGVVLLVLVASAQPATPQSASIYGRRIDASAAITGSPKLRDGAFQLAGTAAICGEIPKEASMTGEATFVIEVAGDTKGSMMSITFGSKQLVGRVASSSAFRLSVGVTTAQGGRPPLYVLNTDTPGNGNTGTAALGIDKGVLTLKVVGANVAKESIALSVTCG